jgi:nicotinamidase-related amidase
MTPSTSVPVSVLCCAPVGCFSQTDPTHPSSIPPSATALLVCDYQNFIVGMLEQAALTSGTDVPSLLARVASVIAACRQRSIPIVYVQLALRPGMQEVSRSNKALSTFTGLGMNPAAEGSAAVAIHSALAPHTGDAVTVKRRVSAFCGSDLNVLLSAMGTRHLMLAGIASGGVVLSTVREAADRDFVLTVISDCCADRDEKVHKTLMELVFPNQAHVLTSAQVIDQLKSHGQ